MGALNEGCFTMTKGCADVETIAPFVTPVI
jgi:hypothetical protein